MKPMRGIYDASSFTEKDAAIIAPNSTLAMVTAPVADGDAIALYEACSGSPSVLAF